MKEHASGKKSCYSKSDKIDFMVYFCRQGQDIKKINKLEKFWLPQVMKHWIHEARIDIIDHSGNQRDR